MSVIYSDTICQLGEGPLWHPLRKSLLWFDILNNRLYEKDGDSQRHWDFDGNVSAAGWVDRDRLLVASEHALIAYNLGAGQGETVCPLEADNTGTRSNDGRADPAGGFWIGTMGKNAEAEAKAGAGAIYRYYRGELRKLYDGITIPNAICFAPDGRLAYFTDTTTRIVRRVALNGDGWPDGEAEDWLDLRGEGLNPDGAVVDAQGRFWNAQWGANRVACYTPDGQLQQTVAFAAAQISCPAFGGPSGTTLFATSAAVDTDDSDPKAGMTFAARTACRGQPEHRVILG